MRHINGLTFKDVLFCSGSYKNKLLKVIDYCFGGLICFLIKPDNTGRSEFDKEKISRILIIRPGGIGDAVLLIPLITALKNIFKNTKIDILAQKRNAGVFALITDKIDQVFCYDNFINLFSLCGKLRQKDYDIIFDTEQWHNLSAAISYYIGGGMRVGFNTRPGRSKLYTRLAAYSQNKYEADNFLGMLRVVLPGEILPQIQPPFISLAPDLISRVKQILKFDKIAAISLSASIKERFWGVDNFKEIANYLIGKDYKVAFLGGRREKKNFRGIFDGIIKKEYVFDFVGKTTLPEAACIIKHSRFFLGLDTGILHLAYALDVPTVSLFGPGIRDKWAPQGSKHVVISKDLECSPCTLFGYTYPCDKITCMKEIKPDDVIAAIEKIESAI